MAHIKCTAIYKYMYRNLITVTAGVHTYFRVVKKWSLFEQNSQHVMLCT